MLYLQSRSHRHAHTQENRRPGFPQHRLPGTVFLAECQLHQREQRRGEDEPARRHLLPVDDQERLPGPRPLQLAVRHGRLHRRRHLSDGQRAGIALLHPRGGRGEEAGPGRQALHPHLRAHRPPAGRDGLARGHRPRERIRRRTPPLRQRRPLADGPQLPGGRPDLQPPARAAQQDAQGRQCGLGPDGRVRRPDGRRRAARLRGAETLLGRAPARHPVLL